MPRQDQQAPQDSPKPPQAEVCSSIPAKDTAPVVQSLDKPAERPQDRAAGGVPHDASYEQPTAPTAGHHLEKAPRVTAAAVEPDQQVSRLSTPSCTCINLAIRHKLKLILLIRTFTRWGR